MSADGLFLRDFVERGLLAFEIPYFYTSGETMEVEVPSGLQPLFCGKETLQLGFGEDVDDGCERVAPGAQVLDGITRLLEGDRNTIGQAIVAGTRTDEDLPPETNGRLNVLNAPIIASRPVALYEPIVKIDVRMRSIVNGRVHSQSVPVFYDVRSAAIVDGAPLCNARVQDVDELARYDGGVLTRPSADEFANAAAAAVAHLETHCPRMAPNPGGTPPQVDLSLVRILVLYRPVSALELRLRDRRTKKEFALTFGADPEEPGSIAPVTCSSCRRTKNQFYLSHRTGRLLCTDCSMLCVGCWAAYDLGSRNCELCSKRRYCPECLNECKCGTPVCPDHAVGDTDDDVYCPDCLPDEPVVDATDGSIDAVADDAETTNDDPFGDDAGDDDVFGDAPEPAVAAPSGRIDPDAFDASPAAEPFGDTEDDGDDIFGDAPDEASDNAPPTAGGYVRVGSMREIFGSKPSTEQAFEAARSRRPSEPRDDVFDDAPDDDVFGASVLPGTDDDAFGADDVFASDDEPSPVAHDGDVGLPPPPDATGFSHEADPDASPIVASRDDYTAPLERSTIGHGMIACTCHGSHHRVEDLCVDFLTGQYYCPDEIEPCSECEQPTAYDFLEGKPPRCFYCTNRMPLNLDPEAEEIFRREIQSSLPFKYRRTSNGQVARSPHHLAFYIKPLVGRELIVYWDLWTSTALLEEMM